MYVVADAGESHSFSWVSICFHTVSWGATCCPMVKKLRRNVGEKRTWLRSRYFPFCRITKSPHLKQIGTSTMEVLLGKRSSKPGSNMHAVLLPRCRGSQIWSLTTLVRSAGTFT